MSEPRRLPSPYATPDLNVREIPEMPLDVERLRQSGAAVELSAEAFRAAVLLWAASWHQVPAGTLPNRDATLAALAGFGRDLDGWLAVREAALRGFELCRDDRLHHELIIDLATRELHTLRAKRRFSRMQAEKAKRGHQARRALSGRAAKAATGYVGQAGAGHLEFTALGSDGTLVAGTIAPDAAAPATAHAAARENGGKTTSTETQAQRGFACPGNKLAPAAAAENPTPPASPPSPSSPSPLKNPPTSPPASPTPPPSPPASGIFDPVGAPAVGGDAARDLLGAVDDGKVQVKRSSDPVPPCPVEKIIELYHVTLPMLPSCRVLASSDKAKLQTRWREDRTRQSLGWWRGYFEYVRDDCPFLTGKTHHGFRASLAWLVGPVNFSKVVNGNFGPPPDGEPTGSGSRQ